MEHVRSPAHAPTPPPFPVTRHDVVATRGVAYRPRTAAEEPRAPRFARSQCPRGLAVPMSLADTPRSRPDAHVRCPRHGCAPAMTRMCSWRDTPASGADSVRFRRDTLLSRA